MAGRRGRRSTSRGKVEEKCVTGAVSEAQAAFPSLKAPEKLPTERRVNNVMRCFIEPCWQILSVWTPTTQL